MKMEIAVKIRNDDGTESIKPITINTDIPEFEEFKGPDNFRKVFHKCEQAVLKIRNKSIELAIEEYLMELSKKSPYEGRRAGRSNLSLFLPVSAFAPNSP